MSMGVTGREGREKPWVKTGVSEPARAEQETARGGKFTACLIAGGAIVPLCTQNPVNSTEAPTC